MPLRRQPPVVPGPGGAATPTPQPSPTPPPTAEPCDTKGCPATALVHVYKGALTLAFCGHCYDDREVKLVTEGWAVKFDGRAALRYSRGAWR